MSSKHPLHIAIALALAVASHAQDIRAQTAAASPDGSADATTLDRIEVRPQLEQQMRAIDFKRSADAIQDTVSSDSMGQYPDKNVGESLSRLPGVSVTRDQGEGRFVVVRGLDAAFNSVSVDGVAIGTPEDSSRAAPLDVIPSDSTERLTVVKAPTPDMPGDAIGGAILVESASAFDRDGRNIRAKAELSHQNLSGQTSPKASFNYSDIFADGTFGVALGLSYQDRNYESDNIEVEYDKDEDISEDLIPVEIQQRKYAINRERTGVNLNLDWRPSEGNSYYLRTLYTDFTDAESRQRSIIPVGEGDFTRNADGTYTVEGIDPGDFSRRLRWRTKEEDTFTVSAGGENRFGAGSIVDYRLGYTKTRERVLDEVEARFEYDGDDDVALLLDTSHAIPRYTITDSPLGGWLDNDNYEFNRFVVSPIWVDDEEHSAAVNFTFAGDTVTWKTGLLGRWRDRDVNIDEAELRRGPDINLGSWTTGSPRYTHGNMGDGISSDAMRNYLRGNLGDYSARPQDVAANTEISLIEDYTASEDVLAGYLMATMDFDKLRVIAGARVERTEFEATGNVVDLEDEETIGSIATREVSSSYTNVLPGLHLRYDLGDWVLRGAYTHTIARPAFGDISPRTRINRDEEEVELGNPGLDPYKSRNFDLSIERYLGETGIVSAGLFYKNIDDYIVEVVTRGSEEFDGFDVTMPVNGDKAKVYGAELNWQQHFDNGLLLGFSATWLDTEYEVNGRKFTLPNASDRLYSAHIGYEKGGLSTRIAAVHRSEYIDSVDSSDSDFDIWVADNTQLDFSLDYKVSDQWGFYFEASNLLDEPLELYQGSSAHTLQNELYGRTYTAGVKLRF
ncbi:TonB-dependent receptor [Pseudoxanthomonas wuyuanensis]|uniref:TonB-dependent receptor n=1 Tax=Pseudoxanthomonas wuyuanensis TaxID=1073196 RepID=A0A286D734_9GAMM|nr:TonB-dependent receptor [Pseudoxanthomonas wuyuanensis]KAF1721095.1 TonB-dependent receptor [Pseudoxanthomonas wuyuanensis]SOD54469.1 TonB-dependent receptor [Pseudoxanthomonas wuyuanensis]